MKFGWRSALGILLSVGFLAYALHDVRWAEVVHHVRQADVLLLALSALAATCIFPLRARRWRPILAAIQPNIPFAKLWSATAIGMMINNVIPARAGEPARAFALSRSVSGVPFTAAFASLAVDRLFDAVVVLLLMFVAMLDPAFPEGVRIGGRPVATYAAGVVVVIVVGVAMMYALILSPGRFVALWERLAQRVVPRFTARGSEILLTIADGLSVLRSPRRFAEVFGWTLLHWLLNAFAFWLAFRAVGITAPFSAALFLQGIIAMGVAIPQAPGFFGVFETFAKVGLAVYGVSADLAVTWAIGFHILSYIPITVMGLFYFIRAGMSMKEIGAAAESPARAAPVTSAPR